MVVWGFPGSSGGKESTCNAGDPGSTPGSERSPREGIGYPLMGFPGGSDGKESAEMWETWVQSWDRKIPGGGHGNPLQDSCLGNPHGQRSLAGDSPRGRKESDMTERLSTA